MKRRIAILLIAVVFSLGLATAPRPASAASLTQYAENLIHAELVVHAVLLLLGSQNAEAFDSIAALVSETPMAGGDTLVTVDVDDTLFGESVQFSGSGVFSDTSGSFSGSVAVGTQTSGFVLVNASLDDPNNPTTFSWDSISTTAFNIGATQLPADGFSFYEMDITGGDTVFVQVGVTGTSQSTSFDFNPHIEITTAFGPTAGQVTSDVHVTPTVIPIPGALLLFATAMGLLGWLRRSLR